MFSYDIGWNYFDRNYFDWDDFCENIKSLIEELSQNYPYFKNIRYKEQFKKFKEILEKKWQEEEIEIKKEEFKNDVIQLKAFFFELEFLKFMISNFPDKIILYEDKLVKYSKKSIDFSLEINGNILAFEITSPMMAEVLKTSHIRLIEYDGVWIREFDGSRLKGDREHSENIEKIHIQRLIAEKSNKFPKSKEFECNFIVIDCRECLAGDFCKRDYHNICYGDKYIKYGSLMFVPSLCSNGKSLVGVFDEEHPNANDFKKIRENIDCIIFVNREEDTDKPDFENAWCFYNDASYFKKPECLQNMLKNYL